MASEVSAATKWRIFFCKIVSGRHRGLLTATGKQLRSVIIERKLRDMGNSSTILLSFDLYFWTVSASSCRHYYQY